MCGSGSLNESQLDPVEALNDSLGSVQNLTRGLAAEQNERGMAQRRSSVKRREVGFTRDEYLAEHYKLVEGQYSSSRRFDTWVLSLAGGSFALSLSFVQNIKANPPVDAWALAVGWIALVATVLSTLVSFRTSFAAHEVETGNLKAEYTGQPPRANPWTAATRILNWISTAAFTMGLGGLAWFGIANL